MNDIPTALRAIVNARSAGRCERCGTTGQQIHHRKRGNPRMHWVTNMVRLCIPCHDWATIHLSEAQKTGWVLTGTLTQELASGTPLPLTATAWAFLDEAGSYRLGDATFGNLSEVGELVETTTLPRRPLSGLAKARLTSMGTGQPYDPRASYATGLNRSFHVVGGVDVPALFRYQRGDTVEDFLARLNEVEEPVGGVE